MLIENRNNLIILTIASGLLMILSLLFVNQVKANEYEVIINELAWAGSSYSASDEFIELKNLTENEIDLSGWQLTRISGNEEKVMLTIPAGEIIEARNFYVISNWSSDDSALDFQPDLIDSSVSLSNSKLQIKLYDADGELIDLAGDGLFPLAGDNEFKASMIRAAPVEKGDKESAWDSSLIAENLDSEISDFATPGAKNFLCIEENIDNDFIDCGIDQTYVSEDAILDETNASTDSLIDQNPVSSDPIDDNFASAESEMEQNYASEDETGQNVASEDDVIFEQDFASSDATDVNQESASADQIAEENFSGNNSASSDLIVNNETASDDTVDEQINQNEQNNEQTLGKLLINEVAFKEDKDWVELSVQKAGNFKNWKLFQGKTLIFEFNQNEIHRKDDFILLNLNKNLTGTDNILVLRDHDYQIQDALIWSNNDGKFTKSEDQADFLVEIDQWKTNEIFKNNDSGAWMSSEEIEKSMSLARVSGLDTNSANDWNFTFEQTPGLKNQIVLTQPKENENESEENDEKEIYSFQTDEQNENVNPGQENIQPIKLKGKLFINEILSHPFPKKTEWVEIYNDSDRDIDVTDFYFAEGSGSKFYLKGKIPSKFYMIIKANSLNNAGDSLEFYSKDDELLDQVFYGQVQNSMIDFDQKKMILPYALVRDSSGFWQLTSLPTPGSENIIEKNNEQNEKEKKEKPAKKSAAKKSEKENKQKENYIELTGKNLNDFQDDDLTFFEGVITVSPGLFLKQRMYMQNKDLAVEIYFHRAEWPDLEIGQKARIKGKFSKKEMPRIKIYNKNDIEVLGFEQAEVKEFSLDKQVELTGFLTAEQGEISEKKSGGFLLVTDEGELPVCFRKNAQLELNDLENQQKVLAEGILLPKKNSVCLYPRLNEDISILPGQTKIAAAPVEKFQKEKSLPIKMILSVIAGVLSSGLGVFYLWKKGKLKILQLAKNQ